MKSWRGNGWFTPRRHESGYTITEVMIVLAVSAVMFVAVAATFRGRQARTEFTQAVRNFEARVQGMLSEVANGTYQPMNCAASGASGRPNFTLPNNGGCIFLGKALLPNNMTSNIVTLIGRRTVGIPPVDASSLAQAEGVVSPATEMYNHSFRLRVVRMVRLSDSTTTVNAIGFMNPFAGATFASAGQGRQLYGLVNDTTFIGSSINPATYIPLPEGVVICLAGQNNQRAEIRVGVANSQSTVFSELDTPNETTGVCGRV